MLLTYAQATHSQTINAYKAVPDAEKRSCIQTVDGYVHLGEDMTLAQARKTAFINAKRQALEMTQTNITSKTKLKDGLLEYDLIWSETEGEVVVLEQKDFGLEDDFRYHVWIKNENW